MKATGSRARSPNSRGWYWGEAEHATEGETVCSQQGSGKVPDEVDSGGGDAGTRACTATQDVGMVGKHGLFQKFYC